MQPTGDRGLRIDGLDQRRHATGPGSPLGCVRGPSEEIRLIAQVPDPHGRVILESGDDCGQQQLGRLDHQRVGERIAIAAVHDLAAADHLHHPGIHGLVGQQHPGRRPAWPAHVAGEEGDVQAQSQPIGDVTDRLQVA